MHECNVDSRWLISINKSIIHSLINQSEETTTAVGPTTLAPQPVVSPEPPATAYVQESRALVKINFSTFQTCSDPSNINKPNKILYGTLNNNSTTLNCGECSDCVRLWQKYRRDMVACTSSRFCWRWNACFDVGSPLATLQFSICSSDDGTQKVLIMSATTHAVNSTLQLSLENQLACGSGRRYRLTIKYSMNIALQGDLAWRVLRHVDGRTLQPEAP